MLFRILNVLPVIKSDDENIDMAPPSPEFTLDVPAGKIEKCKTKMYEMRHTFFYLTPMHINNALLIDIVNIRNYNH